MPRIRLHIRYQGTDFCGWQKQPQPKIPTIQGHLEEALEKLTKQPLATVGSGRTDAGTHARMQVVHFDVDHPADKYPWVKALNAFLPETIQVYAAFEVPDDFHALLSADRKEYIYYIENTELKPVFRREFCWHVKHPLSLGWLNEASQHFCGEKDFRSFQNTGTDVPSTIKTVFSATWSQSGPTSLAFRIQGDGFLKQMVRNLVGTLVEMQWTGAKSSEVLKVLQAQNREAAGLTAPASGLFLNWVKYPPALDNQCRKL